MKLSKTELAALSRIEGGKAFHGDPLILARAYRRLEAMGECEHKYRGYYAELAYKESPPAVKENPPMLYLCEYCKEVLNWKEVVQILNEHVACRSLGFR